MANPQNADIPRGLEGRDGEVWRLRAVNRWTQEKVAAHLGISQQRVSKIEAKVREDLGPIDKGAMIRESLDLYAANIAALRELAEMEGAPVTAGKDGDLVLDPVTGKHVRDYGARMAALKLINDTDAQVRKLLGLDAATKTEVAGSMKIEIVGVSPEDDLT
jgi:DNA-binding XRE family transcriptional regulator